MHLTVSLTKSPLNSWRHTREQAEVSILHIQCDIHTASTRYIFIFRKCRQWNSTLNRASIGSLRPSQNNLFLHSHILYMNDIIFKMKHGICLVNFYLRNTGIKSFHRHIHHRVIYRTATLQSTIYFTAHRHN